MRTGVMLLWMVATAVLVSASAASAAGSVVGPTGDAMLPRLQQWAREDAMPTGDAVQRIVPQDCTRMQAAACTYWQDAPHEVTYFPDLDYLWSQDGYSERDRETTRLNYYHELGHVLDFGLREHRYRLAWFKIMHYTNWPSRDELRSLRTDRAPDGWFLAFGEHGEEVIPDEQFAQAYNYCAARMSYSQMWATSHTTYWGFDYSPTARQYREACNLIAKL